jgi:hypothetical protein
MYQMTRQIYFLAYALSAHFALIFEAFSYKIAYAIMLMRPIDEGN